MSELARIMEMEELEAAENAEVGQEQEEVAVLDDASAEMLLDRIRWANQQYERMEAWYAQQLEKAAAIRDRTVAWAERGLRSYLDMVPAKRTKTQISYELPSGKLVLKNQGPEFERDEDALVKWLEESGLDDLVKVKKTSNWAELKKTLKEAPDGRSMMTEDGEIVPGITVEQRTPKFTVTLK